MKKLQKCMALALVLAMLLPVLPTFAEEALGRPVRARYYYEIYYDNVKVSDTVKVDSFQPEKWTIHYYKKVNGRQVGQTRVLTYPDNYDFELRRYADTVDSSKITARTRVRFDNFRIKTIRGEEKLPDPLYFPNCYIEPTVTPQEGNPQKLQALLDELTPIMAEIQYLPWKDPKDVDEGI